MSQRNLVVVRAGKGSLHHKWVAEDGPRNWDLIVSYYDRFAFEQRPNKSDSGVLEFLHPGGKWEGIFDLFNQRDLISGYDYFLFPDDDIDASSSTINTVFELARENEFAVCQPSLTHDSYFSHVFLASCSPFLLRFVNLVEIMVPCLRRDTLETVLPFFRGNKSGFGLDYIWHRFGQDNFGRAAVLDCVRVRHTRPVSTSTQRIFVNGVLPETEMREVTSAFGLGRKHRPLAYGGVTNSGRVVRGRIWVGIRMSVSYLRERRTFVTLERPTRKILKVLVRQLTKKVDLSPLRVDHSANMS